MLNLNHNLCIFSSMPGGPRAPGQAPVSITSCPSHANPGQVCSFHCPAAASPGPNQAQPIHGLRTRPQPQGGAPTQGWGCAGVPSCPALGWGQDGPWPPTVSLPLMRIPCHYRHLGHCGSLCVRGSSFVFLSVHFRVRE